MKKPKAPESLIVLTGLDRPAVRDLLQTIMAPPDRRVALRSLYPKQHSHFVSPTFPKRRKTNHVRQ